jgi:hypothetical protein
MSRAPVATNAIVVQPTNNIYTGLLAVAVLLQVIAIISVVIQYQSYFGKSLFGQ